MRSHRQGFALVSVLWLAAMLAILALGYASTARLKAVSLKNGGLMQEDVVALPGLIERGRMEYQKFELNEGIFRRQEPMENILGEDQTLWFPRYEPFEAALGDERYGVRILNETGKLNVNTLSFGRLMQLLDAMGLEHDQAQPLANAIADWIDKDDGVRIDGAESDYYLGLDTPYLCKNGEIESIEELLLVKHVTPELFYGTRTRPGLVQLLTTHGDARKFDYNSAAPEAFYLVEGMDAQTVAALVQARAEKPLTASTLSSTLPGGLAGAFYVWFTESERYVLTITAARTPAAARAVPEKEAGGDEGDGETTELTRPRGAGVAVSRSVQVKEYEDDEKDS